MSQTFSSEIPFDLQPISKLQPPASGHVSELEFQVLTDSQILHDAESTETGIDNSLQQLRLVVDNLHHTLDEISLSKISIGENSPQADAHAHMQRLIDALPAALLVLDVQGTIIEVNAAALTLLQEPLIGEVWRQVVTRNFTAVGEGGELVSVDGRYYAVATQPLQGESGQVILLNDVSETRGLQKLVEQRSRLEVIGEMFTRLAHQLGTPLSTLELCVQELGVAADQPRRLEELSARAGGAVAHLLSLVKNLQMFVRGGPIEKQATCLPTLIEKLHRTVAAQLENASARLEISDVPGVLVAINADGFISAVQNLIDNAIHAKPQGLVLRLSAETQGDHLRLLLEDNGPGISAAQRERIFKPFFTTREQGTGLGLAIARSVIEGCDGRLNLIKSSKFGSSFRVELPIHHKINSEGTQ